MDRKSRELFIRTGLSIIFKCMNNVSQTLFNIEERKIIIFRHDLLPTEYVQIHVSAKWQNLAHGEI